jgi:hypothetical protein
MTDLDHKAIYFISKRKGDRKMSLQQQIMSDWWASPFQPKDGETSSHEYINW